MNKQQIITHLFELIQQYLEQESSSETTVVDYKTPEELVAVIDLEVQEQGVGQEDFQNMMEKYLAYSVRTNHKQFVNQLYSGFNFPSFIGEVLTSLSNTSMYTFEVAPLSTMIEMEMIRLMNTYTGFEQGDGIFLTGGSNANLMAMFSARNKTLPKGRFLGLQSAGPFTVFVSRQAHYSFENAANLLGVGSHHVIKVDTNESGSMDVRALEKAIKQSLVRGETPMFVGATCGTTVLGAFDPLDEMAAVCKNYGLWLHADGAFGGSLILSPELRHHFKGLEHADSFSWNPHKLMNIPLVCSVLLVKEKGSLQANLTELHSDYIFHDHHMAEDLGKKSIQCGRRVDAVKLWFAWKYYGLSGYARRMEGMIRMAAYAEKKVVEHPNLELLASRQSLTVCFRYRPDVFEDLNFFNLQLREKLRQKGKSIVNYAFLEDQLAIRLVISNGEMDKKDVDQFFTAFLDEAGKMEQALSVYFDSQ